MSMKDWKEGLEERLAWHLFNHPEQDQVLDTPKKNVVIVEVWESHIDKGSWCVWRNGLCMKEFSGPLARRDAEDFADYLRKSKS